MLTRERLHGNYSLSDKSKLRTWLGELLAPTTRLDFLSTAMAFWGPVYVLYLFSMYIEPTDPVGLKAVWTI